MSHLPLVSIVCPALNEEKDLPILLKDLEKQTNKEFEVIIVDAKSNDRTKEKVLEFKNKLHLKLIQVDKRSVAFQRNIGSDNATGTYIFFLDADARVEKDCIEKLVSHIKNEKKLLYLPYIAPGKKSFLYKVLFAIAIWVVVTLSKINKPISFGPAIVIKKSFFEKIGKFDEKAIIAEDHNLIIKSYHAGVGPTFLPDLKTIYSMRRFESKGVLKTAFMYIYFTFITLFRGGVYKTSIDYKMGGDQHRKQKS